MTVYVDDMYAPFGRMKMCHMVAHTEEELHQMARLIGLARRWYQKDHYDVSMSLRAKAVSFGAKEITQKQLGAMVANYRATGKLGDPDTAIFEFRTRRAAQSKLK